VEDVFRFGGALDGDGGALAVGREGVGEDVAGRAWRRRRGGAPERSEKEPGIAAGFAVDDGIGRGRVVGGEIGEGLAVGGPGVGVDGGAVGFFAEEDFAVGEVGEEFAVGGPAGAAARGDGDGLAGGEAARWTWPLRT
jgi:hypothetical protein